MKKERLQQTMQNTKYYKDYCEQLYGNKMDNLEEMDRFLEKFNLPILNQEEIEIMNNPITSTEIEAVIKNLSKTKAQDQMASQENSIKYMEFKKIVTITLYAKQKKRHRCIEQSFGLCGRRQGWDDLRE